MKEKEDLRVVKTKAAIKETFIELVERKGFNKLSVSEITEMANINRNTFYLHYVDKEDLAKKIIDECSSSLTDALYSYSRKYRSTLSTITEVELHIGLRYLLRLIEPNLELYRVYMLDDSLVGYIKRFSEEVKKALAFMLNVKNTRSNVIYEYAFSGMMGVIEQWIVYSPVTSNETASILTKLAYANLQTFKTTN